MPAFEIAGVREDQIPLIQLNGPAAGGLGNANRSDGDTVASKITEILNDDPTAFITAVGIHPHTLAHREVITTWHTANLLRGNSKQL